MCRKLSIMLLCAIALTGCGSMTEDLPEYEYAVLAGETIVTEPETEPEADEITESSEPEENGQEETEEASTEEPSEPESLATVPENQPETTQSSLIPGIHLGMTEKQVFAVVGSDYDYVYTEDFYQHTTEYYYFRENTPIAGIEVPGYAFFEFDEENDGLLICYGYHFGHNGNFDTPEYPLSEEALAKVYDNILTKMIGWYGEPGEPEYQVEDAGLRSESAWENHDGKFWLIYGVNLWGMEEPETYEQGINEVLVSCSAR